MVISDELHNRIEAALDTVRGYLKSDGGDVKIHKIQEDGTLQLELLGNCEACSMSSMTMTAGIEKVVFRVAPEIKKVEAINQLA
ncbi:MAG: NifU family protein [Bacteroidota bacterium]